LHSLSSSPLLLSEAAADTASKCSPVKDCVHVKKNNPTTLDNQPIKCMFFKRVQQKQQQEKKRPL